ncbi:MAG: DNA topoisomerase 1 [candidate division WS2 bacterium ADurb.Bin280]|uniref:DNA topoisomerase 1 n=1 Tax=candidate division WS2 bacterium ADurb.Bin280 TaxID=1852829 RepID=A0A1V5SCW2_9BACT|nr:MAG: DNA topoisomerase 1 [candidate division WS2 bacterium ADurb.Bin280]
MAKNLLIVESPAKAKTINKYLGSDFLVEASFGHVRDLPSSKLGVDTKNNFEVSYLVPTKSRKVVNKLKKEYGNCQNVYLATDPDREGEAIAWHITEALGIANQNKNQEKSNVKRVSFSEITKDAVLRAVQNPRDIDMDLVDAQQARRVLDRLVGYTLSPLLWRKIMKGLSAGRVQSVAVRLVVEREREIEAFKPQEYWSIEATLEKDSQKFTALLTQVGDRKIDKISIESEKEAKDFEEKLNKGSYIVENVEQKEERRSPYAPFTTSTLQQEASNRFGFSAKQTMRVAQGLYEAGHITYMRTDSVNLSAQSVDSIRSYIQKEFGKEYLPEQKKTFKTKTKNAQEAHEAIRPTDISLSAEKLGAEDQRAKKLYELIWRRAVASQMESAVLDKVTVKIKNDQFIFTSNGQMVKFDGFLKVYPTKIGEVNLPTLEEKDVLKLIEINSDQHFTQPPARYSEATLIRALEERGIGRPSTYAPTLSTIQDRGYVVKDSGRLKPEDIGFAVNDLLVKHFPDIVDYSFTAKVEEDLDRIADGNLKWQKMVEDFFVPFEKSLESQEGEIEKQNLNKELDEKCPECGKNLLLRRSKRGKFIGCSGFPECKYTRNFIDEKTQEKIDEGEKSIEGRKCPKCGGDLKIANGRFGPFIGCSKYPDCKYIEKIKKPEN